MSMMSSILEGLNESRDVRKQLLKTEGTTSSDIATPSGKVIPTKEKTYTCPKCGSTDVLITDEGKFHCTACDTEWDVDQKPEDEKKDEKASKDRKSVDAKLSESAENVVFETLCALCESGNPQYGTSYIDIKNDKNVSVDIVKQLISKFKMDRQELEGLVVDVFTWVDKSGENYYTIGVSSSDNPDIFAIPSYGYGTPEYKAWEAKRAELEKKLPRLIGKKSPSIRGSKWVKIAKESDLDTPKSVIPGSTSSGVAFVGVANYADKIKSLAKKVGLDFYKKRDGSSMEIYKGRTIPLIAISNARIGMCLQRSTMYNHSIEISGLSEEKILGVIKGYIWLAFGEDCGVPDSFKKSVTDMHSQIGQGLTKGVVKDTITNSLMKL